MVERFNNAGDGFFLDEEESGLDYANEETRNDISIGPEIPTAPRIDPGPGEPVQPPVDVGGPSVFPPEITEPGIFENETFRQVLIGVAIGVGVSLILSVMKE